MFLVDILRFPMKKQCILKKEVVIIILKRKIINKTYYYGIYATLEDAQKVRDELIEIGWEQDQVHNICLKCGVDRIPGQNEERYFEVTS